MLTQPGPGPGPGPGSTKQTVAPLMGGKLGIAGRQQQQQRRVSKPNCQAFREQYDRWRLENATRASGKFRRANSAQRPGACGCSNNRRTGDAIGARRQYGSEREASLQRHAGVAMAPLAIKRYLLVGFSCLQHR